MFSQTLSGNRMAALGVWIKANTITLLARLGLSRFIVEEFGEDKSEAAIDRHLRHCAVILAVGCSL